MPGPDKGLKPGPGLDKLEARPWALRSFGHGFEGLGSARLTEGFEPRLHITTYTSLQENIPPIYVWRFARSAIQYIEPP